MLAGIIGATLSKIHFVSHNDNRTNWSFPVFWTNIVGSYYNIIFDLKGSSDETHDSLNASAVITIYSI